MAKVEVPETFECRLSVLSSDLKASKAGSLLSTYASQPPWLRSSSAFAEQARHNSY